MHETRAQGKLPVVAGPYSPSVTSGNLVFTSGQIPLSPENGAVVSGGIEEQTKQAIDNLAAVLVAAGSSLQRVIKTTCYITDMQNFPDFNQIYASYFPTCPARSCVAVRELPKNVLVEIEAIAMVD